MTTQRQFNRIVTMLAVRSCWESGCSVAKIAKDCGRSTSTVRRWLQISGATNLGKGRP